MSHFVYFAKGPAINLDLVMCATPSYNEDSSLNQVLIHYMNGTLAAVTEQDAVDLWEHIQSCGVCLGNWEASPGG